MWRSARQRADAGSKRAHQELAAYDAYLRGVPWRGTIRRRSARAAAEYERAVALDPSFALAWARLGATYATLYVNGVPTPELGRSARRAADRAIALAPETASGYYSLAAYFRNVDIHPDSAEAATQTGLRLDPGSPRSLGAQSAAASLRGQWDSALVYTQAGLERDPRAAGRWLNKAALLMRLDRYPEARIAADRAAQLAPTDPQVAETRAVVDLLAGDLTAARATLKRSQVIRSRWPPT